MVRPYPAKLSQLVGGAGKNTFLGGFFSVFCPVFCFFIDSLYMTRIFWKKIGPSLLFLAARTTDTKFRRSTGVTTANSTNKYQKYKSVELGDQLLIQVIFIMVHSRQKYDFILPRFLVKLGSLFHMKAKHVRYDNLSVHVGAEPWTVHPAFLFWHFSAVLGNAVTAWSTKPGFKQLLVFIGQWYSGNKFLCQHNSQIIGKHGAAPQRCNLLLSADSAECKEARRQTAITVGNVNGHWWLNRQQELLWEVFGLGERPHCASG